MGIIGYTFRADIYGNCCIVNALTTLERFDGWALGEGVAMSVEDNLNEIARAFQIDRMDERSFDSDEFPKVIFSSMVEGIEACGGCGEAISE